MVRQKIDKIIAYKIFYLLNAYINLDTFEAFSFANIDIIYQRISFFFISFVQLVIDVIKTSAIFNSKQKLNTGSFIYIAKQGCQAPLGSKNNNNDSKIIGFKAQILQYKTEDGYIKQEVNIFSDL